VDSCYIYIILCASVDELSENHAEQSRVLASISLNIFATFSDHLFIFLLEKEAQAFRHLRATLILVERCLARLGLNCYL
jgi:hypothetical protein